MSEKRTVEIFTAECPICQEVVSKISDASCCDSCETVIVNTQKSTGAERAKELGVSRLPAIAVDGELLGCCETSPIDFDMLKQACS